MNCRQVFVFAIFAMLALMTGAVIHEVFEGHDLTAAIVDPDYLVIAAGALLATVAGGLLVVFECLIVALLLVALNSVPVDRDGQRQGRYDAALQKILASPRGLLPLRL